ncbi:MAG: S24 family peptidase [Desulfuromonadaceae bacterium]|nr:S24 family peptidase [Desulfuromonadaceae bacterium]MDD2856033.1 S24 family peptidase [Desulfuromonadaceae bacterium]
MSTENKHSVNFVLNEIAKSHGFTKETEIARHLGVSKQTILNWRNRNSIGDYSLFTDIGYSEKWVRTGIGSMFAENKAKLGLPRPEGAFDVPQASRRIPVISWAQAGVEGFFVDSHVVGGGFTDISCPYDVSDPSAYALEISGDSMFPKYEDGDYVVVSPARGVQTGNDAIVKLRDGQIMAKRIKAKNGEFVLSSLNPSYEDLHYKAENILFMHRIVWVKPRG